MGGKFRHGDEMLPWPAGRDTHSAAMPCKHSSYPAAGPNARTVREPQDWQPCEQKTLVRHVPTHAIFEFYPREDMQPQEFLELEDFRVALVHLCPGHPHPCSFEYRILCREAILMGLHFLGLVALAPAPGAARVANDDDDDDEIPF